MFESLARALATGLQLWEDKESTKYQDQLIDLRQKYYVEDNKPLDSRNDAYLDFLEFQLRVLADSFSARAGKSNAQAKP